MCGREITIRGARYSKFRRPPCHVLDACTPPTLPTKSGTQQDGTGSATTTIEDVSVAELFGEDKERFILLHAETKEGEGVPPGIACADLAPLAETGGIRPATLFLAGAISVLGVAAGLFILQRRIGAEN